MSKQRFFNPLATHLDSNDYEGDNEPEVTEIKFEALLGETHKAYHIGMKDGTDHWLPKSQVEMYKDDLTVVVPDWLVAEKGLT